MFVEECLHDYMLALETQYSIIYYLLCPLIGFLYAFLLYRKNYTLSYIPLFILFTFRFIVVSVLLFLLFDPKLKKSIEIEEKPILVLAQDASLSCFNYSDSKKLGFFKKKLSDKFDVYAYNFSNKVNKGLVDEKDKIGSLTNIGELLDQIEVDFSGRNLSSIILSSDGVFNDGKNPHDHNISTSIPFYSIALGDTMSFKDIRIVNILYNQISFLGNRTPLELQIQADQCAGETVEVSIYNQNNELLFKKEHRIQYKKDFIKLNVFIEHEKIGNQKYTAVLNNITGETNIDNNSFSFYVDVVDNRSKILLLSDFTHPDISAIRSVLDKYDNLQVKFSNSEDFLISSEDYDLIVPFFLSNKKVIERLDRSNIPLLLFVNKQSLISLNELYNIGKVSSGSNVIEVVPFYNKNFASFNVSDKLSNYFNSLPPLHSLRGTYNKSITADVLMYQNLNSQQIRNPLIILDKFLDRRIGVVYGEGIWRWKINDNMDEIIHQNFNECFIKIFNYLLIKEDKDRFRVVYEREINEDENIKFRAMYYNDNFELNNSKDVMHTIMHDQSENITLKFIKKDSIYHLDVGFLPVGDYSFLSSYNFGEEEFSGQFTILPNKIEDTLTSANHQILYQLSTLSGGKMFNNSIDPSDITKILNEKNSDKIVIHYKTKYVTLISFYWLLIFLLAFLCFEWIIRRYNGFY